MRHATSIAITWARRISAFRPVLVSAAFASLLLIDAGLVSAQQPRCEKPLGLDDLTSLLEARVSDARVQQLVTDCGVTFQVDEAAERRLRKAGGSKAVVALARLAAGRGAAAASPTPAAPASVSPVTAGADWLEAARDESSLEHRIMGYLKSKGLSTYTNDKPEDLRVWVSYAAGEGTPAYDISIDTLSSARDGTERVVQISLFTRQIIDASRWDEVARHLNEHHRTHWSGTFHIDADNEIVGQWHINIPGAGYPVHTELVYDAVQRLGFSWTPLYKEIAAMLDHAR